MQSIKHTIITSHNFACIKHNLLLFYIFFQGIKMSIKKTVAKIFCSVSLVALAACVPDLGPSPISGILPFDGINFFGTKADEFEFAYEALDFLYLNAHSKKELKSRKFYKGEGSKSAYKDYPYPDIYNMFSQMSCPFTRYYDPSYYDRLKALLNYSEKNIGIGIEIKSDSTGTKITQVYPKAPGEKAGLKKGDIILDFDKSNKQTENQPITSDDLIGDEGDKISLTIKRNDDTLHFNNIYFKIFLTPTVLIDEVDSIPVIRITEFTDTTITNEGTYGEFLTALKQTSHYDRTVIDLRNNGGGSVEHCMHMAAEMMTMETTLAYTREATIAFKAKRRDTTYYQKIDTLKYTGEELFDEYGDGIGKGRYYVFLQDSGTASCSELMIMAVTASVNAPVVGTLGYGKAIGQTYIETPKKGFVGITLAQMYDKNMNTYHEYGIMPDFVITDPDSALMKAVELAKEGTYQRTAGYGTVKNDHFVKKALAKSTEPKKDFEFNRKDYFGAFWKITP